MLLIDAYWGRNHTRLVQWTKNVMVLPDCVSLKFRMKSKGADSVSEVLVSPTKIKLKMKLNKTPIFST